LFQLDIDGIDIPDPSLIQHYILEYFKNIFRKMDTTWGELGPIVWNDREKVTQSENDILILFFLLKKKKK
jgi:hypothetical protein